MKMRHLTRRFETLEEITRKIFKCLRNVHPDESGESGERRFPATTQSESNYTEKNMQSATFYI